MAAMDTAAPKQQPSALRAGRVTTRKGAWRGKVARSTVGCLGSIAIAPCSLDPESGKKKEASWGKGARAWRGL